MVKHGAIIRFNFYNIKTGTSVFHFIKIYQEQYHEISQINTSKVGVNPYTHVYIHRAYGPRDVYGLKPPFSVFYLLLAAGVGQPTSAPKTAG